MIPPKLLIRRTIGGFALVLLVWTLSGGCAAVPERLPSPADSLKGKTREQILACAGPPTEWKSNDGAVLIYYRSAWSLARSPAAQESALTGSRPGCRALLVLKHDRVDDVHFLSVPESADAVDHCRRIFSGCDG
jgi:hypothetical protein